MYMPTSPIVGLHHVTAFASDPQRNLDFYTETLGLRFLKRTVNFDDPGTYHFYFGDDLGSPGTIMTSFPGPRAARGTPGVGETSHVAFSIPLQSIDFWADRLAVAGVPVERTGKRFDEEVLTFADPDGMKIELVGHRDVPAAKAPRFADVPPEHSIRGFFGVSLLLHQSHGTAATLEMMGFTKTAEDGNRQRFQAEGNALGNHIDLVINPQRQVRTLRRRQRPSHRLPCGKRRVAA